MIGRGLLWENRGGDLDMQSNDAPLVKSSTIKLLSLLVIDSQR